MTAPLLDIPTLNEVHRARQAQNALATQRLVAQLFSAMVNPTNIAGTSQRWLGQAIVAIVRGRQSSWLLASAYATAIRRLQVPDAPALELPELPELNREKLVRSLMYTGPGKLAVDLAKTPAPIEPEREDPEADFQLYDLQREAYERKLEEAPVKAAMAASAAAYRHVTDAGRELVHTVIRTDPVAVGYMRITKIAPCAFCLMLASRGPVYSKESFDRSDPRFEGDGESKVHDSCGCSLQPLFGGKSTKHWTDMARQAEALWINGDGVSENGKPPRSPSSYSGAEARNAFARAARRAGLADLTRW